MTAGGLLGAIDSTKHIPEPRCQLDELQDRLAGYLGGLRVAEAHGGGRGSMTQTSRHTTGLALLHFGTTPANT